MQILFLNGPNLNLLGTREPAVYGSQTLDDVKKLCQRAAKANGCAIRIGVNAGSLEQELLERYGEPCPEAMVESALNHAKILDDLDFHEYKISVKASDISWKKHIGADCACVWTGIRTALSTKKSCASSFRWWKRFRTTIIGNMDSAVHCSTWPPP